ncbi:MAG: hypothetical protein JEZ11_12155 [Desulfobacterales bacterium]|nr:hypothetical protein [Desulfobacterales bacterium]
MLILAGLGVFYRIPQVMARLQGVGSFSSESFFIRFCFYLMGSILIGGGARKIICNYKLLQDGPPESHPDGP